jgi:hypothetical protein
VSTHDDGVFYYYNSETGDSRYIETLARQPNESVQKLVAVMIEHFGIVVEEEEMDEDDEDQQEEGVHLEEEEVEQEATGQNPVETGQKMSKKNGGKANENGENLFQGNDQIQNPFEKGDKMEGHNAAEEEAEETSSIGDDENDETESVEEEEEELDDEAEEERLAQQQRQRDEEDADLFGDFVFSDEEDNDVDVFNRPRPLHPPKISSTSTKKRTSKKSLWEGKKRRRRPATTTSNGFDSFFSLKALIL